MEEERPPQNSRKGEEEQEDPAEAAELVLFHVKECYVYLIPPRKSAASYRADEWDVNKWAWEGQLKVVSKGEECTIKLVDKETGELYAQAFLRKGEPHPVEAVIDSSRYFVLRVEENIGGRLRHAFIGIGFRERDQAYDFQASLHDHMKYLDKKKEAEEMEQHFQASSSLHYSLKEGETLVLRIKNKGSGGSTKSAFFQQGLNNMSSDEKSNNTKLATISLKPPPPPPAPVSPVSTAHSQRSFFAEQKPKESASPDDKNTTDSVDDDFGDFQAAN